jgi:hypothetical protein
MECWKAQESKKGISRTILPKKAGSELNFKCQNPKAK